MRNCFGPRNGTKPKVRTHGISYIQADGDISVYGLFALVYLHENTVKLVDNKRYKYIR